MDAIKEIREALGAIETKSTEGAAALEDTGVRLKGTLEQREHLKAFERHLRRPKEMGLRAELAQIEHKAASGVTDSAGGAVVPELL